MGRLFDSPAQLLILLLILVLLFGAKRLPDAARGLGRSMRILKSEVRDMKDEEAVETPRPSAVEGRVIANEDRTTTEPAPRDQRHDA